MSSQEILTFTKILKRCCKKFSIWALLLVCFALPVHVQAESTLLDNPPVPPTRPETFHASPAFFQSIRKQMIVDHEAKIVARDTQTDAVGLANIEPAAGNTKPESELEVEETSTFDILNFVESLGLEKE
jgi:hypothetical protein